MQSCDITTELVRVCRVPEECPVAIATLCLACTSTMAKDRPSAQEAMDVIEGSLLVIPGTSSADVVDLTSG